jgi:hypothetical protein
MALNKNNKFLDQAGAKTLAKNIKNYIDIKDATLSDNLNQ